MVHNDQGCLSRFGGCFSVIIGAVCLLALAAGALLLAPGQLGEQGQSLATAIADFSIEGVATAVLGMPVDLSMRQASYQAIPINQGGDGIQPDLLVYEMDMTSQTNDYYLSYRGHAAETPWSIKLGPSSQVYPSQIRTAVEGSTLYFVQDNRLRAYNINNGALLWETNLSDLINTSCTTCLQIAGQSVIVLTVDRVLQAYNLEDGEPLWDIRLKNGESYLASKGFLAFDDRIGILDAIDEKTSYKMDFYLYNASDGSLLVQLHPACSDPGQFFDDEFLSTSSTVMTNPSKKNEVYFFIDAIYGLCVQAWNVKQTEAPLWGTVLESGMPQLEDISWSHTDIETAVLSSSHLYWVPSDQTVVDLDLTSGGVQKLFSEQDYDLMPLAEQGDILVLTAKRTRGSERNEIWGINLKSGKRVWTHILEADDLLENGFSSGGGTWAYHITPQGMSIIQISEDPDHLLYQSLNLTNGRVDIENASNLSDTFLTGVAWTNNYAFITIRGIYSLNLQTGVLSTYQ